MKKTLILGAVAAVMSVQVQAQSNDKWVAGFAEYYLTETPNLFNNGKGLGVEFGIKFSPNWAARFEYSHLEIDIKGKFLDQSGKRFGVDALYFLDEQIYFFGGIKNIEIIDGDASLSVGFGKHWNLGQSLDLAQYWEYGNNIQFITEIAAYQPIASSDTDAHLGLKFGLSYAFGGTAAPSMPIDADNDGVVDSKDQCSNTPAGTLVDAKGCNLDLDGDSVINRLDNCPNTPAGTKVDSYGCNNDLDGDGIANNLDKCSNTVKGTRVGANGCIVLPAKGVSKNLDVSFTKNSSGVSNANSAQFKNFADFMKKYPNTEAVIEGHASAPGSASYNMTISQKRADAVKALLINEYGISASRLTSIGFGETQLLDTSNTARAHETNRRITAKVSASDK